MKRKLPLILILLLACVTILKAQVKNDYRSLGSGVSVDISDIVNFSGWQYYNGTTWVTATQAPFATGANKVASGNTITIQSGDTWNNASTLSLTSGVTIEHKGTNGTLSTTNKITLNSGTYKHSTSASETTVIAGLVLSTGSTIIFNNPTATSAATAASMPVGVAYYNATIPAGIYYNALAGTTKVGGTSTATSGTLKVDGQLNLGNVASVVFDLQGGAASTGCTLSGAGNIVSSGNNTSTRLTLTSTSSVSLNFTGSVCGFTATVPAVLATDVNCTGQYFFNAASIYVDLNGHTLTTGSTGGTAGNIIFHNTTPGSLVTTTGAATAIQFDTNPLNNLTIGGTGGSLNSNLTINGTLTLAAGTVTTTGYTLTLGNGATIVKTAGSLSAAPTFGTSANITYNGTSAQTTGVEFPTSASVLNDLNINNSAGVTLSTSSTVNGTLTLTSGILTTGSNTLTIATAGTGTVNRTGGWVKGNLQRAVASGASTVTYDIGDVTNYTPVALTFVAGTGAGNLTATTAVPGTIPTGSVINAAKYINRYWTLSGSSLTNPNYSAAFTYINPGDIVGGANTNSLIVAQNNGGTWSTPAIASSISPTVITSTGLTSFGSFYLGNKISSDATLSNLVLNGGTITPIFASGTNAYTASVANATTSITITPTTNDATATVTVNGTAVTSGNPSSAITLNVGSNTITMVVTAQDGSTTQTYTLMVTRAALSNAGLASLAISNGTLSPVFATATAAYTASVANSVTSVTITPTVSDATATVTVNGTAVTSGSASSAIALNVGSNTLTTIVTAQDGVTTQTYTVTVTRAASSDATLSTLTLNSGTLSPIFAGATNGYTANVSNGTTSISVTPTTNTATATVTVNGTTVTSGSASSAIALTVGNNTIAIIVTAQDGITTQTYTVTVTRVASSNAGLASLAISNGTLSPVFATTTNGYTASVANSVNSITVTPTVNDATASVIVNGTAVTSGSVSSAVALNVGGNTITTIVTAQDGVTTQTYTLTVTRAASSNANLGNFVVSSGTLTPAFSASTTSYAAGVSIGTASITVTPTVADATASVTVNGTAVSSGSASGAITINTGSNTITTIVTAQDGTTKTYTLTVSKTALSTNAALAGLTLSAGTLDPVFAGATASYTASVSNATSSLTFTPTVADATASVTVNGTTVSSGSASSAIALVAGNNTITTVVTAQDGVTKETYTVIVTRALSSNANLNALAISSGTLNPVFATATKTYTASVSNATTSVTVSPTLADATATITVNGTTVTSGSASGAIALSVGANTITTVVKAQDGTLNTYTLTVTRISSNANLAGISLSSGILSPAFASATNSYTASVVNATTSITLTPTVSDATAIITVNGTAVNSGNASSAIALTVDNNTITTVVTAQDGTTKNTYTVVITRAASSNANLANLTISSGTLNPVFASATNSYTASVAAGVSSITVTPTLSDATASIKVNGTTVTSGSVSAAQSLSVGNNIITIAITAQDGTTINTYTLIVNRPGTPQTITFGTLSAVTYGAADLTPVASSTNNTIGITFASSNTSVATITSGGAIHIVGAGSTSITASQSGNSVYNAATPVAQSLMVNPAVLTVTANNATKVYGTTNPALSAIYTGYVNGDTQSAITTLASVTSTATAASTVNTYSTTASGAVAANYSFNYVAGSLTVTPAALTITAGNATKVYGAANPTLSATYNGFVNGDTQSNLTTQPTLGTTATVASVVNTYPTMASGAVAANYTISYVAGTLTVTPAALIITANNATATYGSAVPTLSASYAGFVNGDTQAGLTTQPALSTTYTATSAAGTYPITASGAASANYTISYVAGVLTAGKAVLTVTAANATKVYGVANPTFSVTYAGFLNGDGLSVVTTAPTATTTATTTSAAGAYPITATGAAATNYNFTYVPGTLTVTTATRVFAFGSIPTHTYLDADFSAGATVNTGETINYTTSDATVATIVNGLIHIVNAGSVTITASIASSPNYADVQPISQLYTINKATQTISFASLPVLQVGGAVLSLSLTSSAVLPVSFKSADVSIASVNGQTIVPVGVGSTIITATQAGNVNYLPATAYQSLKVQDAVEYVKVKPGLSPNGDGVNDYLTIEGIQDYPNNKLTIVNRNGLKIFQTSGYNNLTNVFDGHSSSGDLLQAGTYFYELELNINGETKRKAGYIILKFN